MTRIVIDPLELAALAAMCRNASYDVARNATAMRYRADAIAGPLSAWGQATGAVHLARAVDDGVQLLLVAASSLDDDALLLAAIGERTDAADAIAEAFGGGEHALLTQLRADPTGGTT